MEKRKVVVTQAILPVGMKLLQDAVDVTVLSTTGPPSREVLLGSLHDADGLLSILTETVDEAVLAAAPKLRVVSNHAVGYDNIDVAAATRRGIVVTNTPGVLTETTADLTWALLMAVARRVVEADAYCRQGRWRTWDPTLLLGTDVHGKTLGIVGYGRIGQAVAARARGFGMVVLSARSQDPLDDLLARSDFVTLHAPLNASTRHLIGRRELSLMPARAYLIDTARGPLVDTEALADALEQGRLRGAALDVFEDEPHIPERLLRLDNCVIAPHIGSASIETRTLMSTMAATNILDVLAGRRPAHAVNPEVLA